MERTVSLTIFIMCLFSVAAYAGAGDPKEGKGKSELCQSCHGPDGNSESPEFPKLAGQKMGYIVKQITDFQKGNRVNETMTGMAATVTSVDDLKDIAAYFSSQKMNKGAGKGSSDLAKAGKEIFEKGTQSGAYGCINCHGENGKGKSDNNDVFPVIGGQHKDYLTAQLKAFKKGDRANDPANMMKDIAEKLSDKDIDAVTEYLSSL